MANANKNSPFAKNTPAKITYVALKKYVKGPFYQFENEKAEFVSFFFKYFGSLFSKSLISKYLKNFYCSMLHEHDLLML